MAMNHNDHRIIRQWTAPMPFLLMLWLDNKISIMSLAVRKPWVCKGEDTLFALVLKLRRADTPFIWLRGIVKEENEKRMLQLSVTHEPNDDTATSYVTDRMKAYDLRVGDLFRILVRYGFDQYRVGNPGDGRDWIFKLRSFLVDHNHLVYMDAEDTPLDRCSPWWNKVEDGLFRGNPDIGPFWSSNESKERLEAVKRCLAEAGV